MTDKYDAIVVGAGHNGLVCSALLARAGKSVLVLEANEQVGGAAVTREFADGYSVSACAHLLYQLQPEVRKELNLSPTLAGEDMTTIALAEDGGHIRLSADGVEGVSDGSALMARSGDMPRWYIVYRLESQVFVQGFGGAEPVVAFPIGGTEAPAPGFRPGLDYGQDGRTELRVAFVTAEGIEQASVEIDDPVVRAERDLQMSLAPTTDGGS